MYEPRSNPSKVKPSDSMKREAVTYWRSCNSCLARATKCLGIHECHAKDGFCSSVVSESYSGILRQTGRVCHSVSRSASIVRVVVLIPSWLDYDSAVPAGVFWCSLDSLQSVINAAVHLNFYAITWDHFISFLRDLCWISVAQWIDFMPDAIVDFVEGLNRDGGCVQFLEQHWSVTSQESSLAIASCMLNSQPNTVMSAPSVTVFKKKLLFEMYLLSKSVFFWLDY